MTHTPQSTEGTYPEWPPKPSAEVRTPLVGGYGREVRPEPTYPVRTTQDAPAVPPTLVPPMPWQPVPPAAEGEAPEYVIPRPILAARAVVIWSLTAVGTYMAAQGQVGTAEWAGLHGDSRYLVPAGLELLSVGFLLIGYVRGCKNESPWPLWFVALLIGTAAAVLNVIHAGPRLGAIYGAFSVGTLILWFADFWISWRNVQKITGKRPEKRPGFSLTLWVFEPRQTHRAWRVTMRQPQVKTTSRAQELATVWLKIVDDLRAQPATKSTSSSGKDISTKWRARRNARRLAIRAAWDYVGDLAGAPKVVLPDRIQIEVVRGEVLTDTGWSTGTAVDPGTDVPEVRRTPAPRTSVSRTPGTGTKSTRTRTPVAGTAGTAVVRTPGMGTAGTADRTLTDGDPARDNLGGMRHADHIMAINAAYPKWRTTMPTVSKIDDAIFAAFGTRSRNTAGKVYTAMKQMRDDDAAIAAIATASTEVTS